MFHFYIYKVHGKINLKKTPSKIAIFEEKKYIVGFSKKCGTAEQGIIIVVNVFL